MGDKVSINIFVCYISYKQFKASKNLACVLEAQSCDISTSKQMTAINLPEKREQTREGPL